MRGHVLALAGVALVCACLACVAPALLYHALSSVVITGSR